MVILQDGERGKTRMIKKPKGFKVAPLKQFKMGGYLYDVYLKEDYVNLHKVWGATNLIKKFMVFDEACPIREALATVVHEGMEAINFQRQLGVEHSDMVNLEDGMLQMMTDNYDFFIKALKAIKKEVENK